MAVNDILSGLLVRMGLKKTEIQECEEAIAIHEERIKDINDQISGQMAKIEALECRLRQLKDAYDAAISASKPLHEAKLRSCMRDFRLEKELQALRMRNLDKEKLLLQNRLLELENLRHPTAVGDIENVCDRKEELLQDLGEEDGELKGLEDASYEPANFAPDAQDVTETRKAQALERDLAALLGENEKPVGQTSEADVEIA